jgi:uracil-DNA glycosylase
VTPGRGDAVASGLDTLNQRIIACCKCPRLVRYRQQVGLVKRRAYREQSYWARPVPGFGDAHARLLIIGLAPGAHGGNRTGRIFTGDSSGNFLYRELHRSGFANQPTSVSRHDGLQLHAAYIDAVIRCAPPANKPSPLEIRNCLPYLEQEFELLRPRAVLALGRIAWTEFLRLLVRRGELGRASEYPFAHGASYRLPGDLPRLFGSYHPSQQNTQTGKLTPAMFQQVLRSIRRFLNRNQAVRIPIRKWLDQSSVDKGEDGRAGAYSQRENEDCS